MIVYKKKKGTEKEYPHTDVWVDGEFVGYYMKSTTPEQIRVVGHNWHFVSKTPNYISRPGKTKKEIEEYIDSVAYPKNK